MVSFKKGVFLAIVYSYEGKVFFRKFNQYWVRADKHNYLEAGASPGLGAREFLDPA